ncbi:Retrovirus-related Pol polyprotein from transposon RE2 [Bienertia sinuspersici]
MNGDSNYITIADGRKVRVTHKGKVILNDFLTLDNVLFIPEFQYNLISVHMLCKELGCNIIFTDGKCYIQDHSLRGQLMLLGKLKQGLYNVERNVKNQECKLRFGNSCHALAINKTSIDEIKLWHLRLGHLPFKQMKYVLPSGAINNCLSDCFCKICPKAKQSKLPFPKSVSISECPFDLVHVDLWGPYYHKIYGGCNQFVTIVDDCTRFT